MGTSPRMRGKHLHVCKVFVVSGNIPAHAGKTPLPTPVGGGVGEHPRACGENTPAALSTTSSSGTSPRMRGKLLHHLPSRLVRGNIPAHAGKTRASKSLLVIEKEHPRACGENNPNPALLPHQAGTSPRMRGKRKANSCWSVYMGNIPAHAGKTALVRYRPKMPAEHPRACGENASG